MMPVWPTDSAGFPLLENEGSNNLANRKHEIKFNIPCIQS